MIPYCDRTWNPVVGCSPVGPGCDHCYAARLASTRLAHLPQYRGLATDGEWTGEVRVVEKALAKRWRKPTVVFVGNMGDLCHQAVPRDKICFIVAAIIRGVLAGCHFLLLTKRPNIMTRFAHDEEWLARSTHVWWGVSAWDRDSLQSARDALLSMPVARRWISLEPMLDQVGAVNLEGIDQMIVGGESGPDARHCAVEWISEAAMLEGPKVFVKQLGSNAWNGNMALYQPDRAGADPKRWPYELPRDLAWRQP